MSAAKGLTAAIALAASAFSFGAKADVVTVGPKGGVYCKDADDLKAMLVEAMAGKPPSSIRSCKMISPGTKIDAIKHEAIGDGVAIGLGRFEGEDMVFTASLANDAAKSKPKPTSEGRSFKRVSPKDVRNTPTKWRGRDIEFADTNVYWVDDDDVRFVTGTSVTLFASDVRGNSADLAFLKSNCETEQEALSRKCRVTIRFSYDGFDEDKPGGLATRTVLKSSDVEAIRASGKR